MKLILLLFWKKVETKQNLQYIYVHLKVCFAFIHQAIFCKNQHHKKPLLNIEIKDKLKSKIQCVDYLLIVISHSS